MDSLSSSTSSDPMLLLPNPVLANFSLTSSLGLSDLRLHSRRTMLALSYLIEDQALAAADTILLAAFQRFSYFEPQRARYAKLAQHVRHIYVFGLDDLLPLALPNVTYVPFVATSPLLHEWFVLALGPTYSAGLFARDLNGQQPLERTQHFAGMWTADSEILDRLGSALEHVLGVSLVPKLRDYSATHQTTRALQHALPQRLRNSSGSRARKP